jgi:hypothetical protein
MRRYSRNNMALELIHTKDIKHDTGSRPVVATADDVAVTDKAYR